MSSFHGNFFVRSTDLLAMPAVPQDQSYAIEVQIEETITSPFVVFQTAILHTTCYGRDIYSFSSFHEEAESLFRGKAYPCYHSRFANNHQPF